MVISMVVCTCARCVHVVCVCTCVHVRVCVCRRWNLIIIDSRGTKQSQYNGVR